MPRVRIDAVVVTACFVLQVGNLSNLEVAVAVVILARAIRHVDCNTSGFGIDRLPDLKWSPRKLWAQEHHSLDFWADSDDFLP